MMASPMTRHGDAIFAPLAVRRVSSRAGHVSSDTLSFPPSAPLFLLPRFSTLRRHEHLVYPTNILPYYFVEGSVLLPVMYLPFFAARAVHALHTMLVCVQLRAGCGLH